MIQRLGDKPFHPMKIYPLLLLATASALAFAGCEDVPTTLREGLAVPVTPHVRVFDANEKATYAAARAALEPMGFSFQHGGPAEREIEAISRVSGGDDLSSARQFTLKAKFDTSVDGSGTEVSVKMTEIDEEDRGRSLNGATETPLTDTPLYEVFFNEIRKKLAAPPAPRQTP